MRVIHIYERDATDHQAVHDQLKRSLGFPDHYGANLDALADCLGDVSQPTHLSLERDGSADRWFDVLCTVVERAASHNPALSCEICSERPRVAPSKDASLEEVGTFFANDRYATASLSPTIMEARPGHAVVRMDVDPARHLNGLGGLMGGVSFTLADYALAIATNVGQGPTVSVTSSIEYLSALRGTALEATCEVDHSGHTLCFATIDVRDDLGTHIARMTATCCRR